MGWQVLSYNGCSGVGEMEGFATASSIQLVAPHNDRYNTFIRVFTPLQSYNTASLSTCLHLCPPSCLFEPPKPKKNVFVVLYFDEVDLMGL